MSKDQESQTRAWESASSGSRWSTQAPAGIAPDETERRRRKRRLLGIQGFVVLLVVVGVRAWFHESDAPPTSAPPTVFATVQSTHGAVEMLSASGAAQGIDAGLVLHSATTLTTDGDAEGRASLLLAGDVAVRVDDGTRLTIESSRTLRLEKGAVYVDSTAAAAVEVRTTFGVVRDVGTRFEVRIVSDETGEALRVRVRDGMIDWTGNAGGERAAAGQELKVDAAGGVERREISVWGPNWNWIFEATAVPDFEGESARAFFEWYAAEGARTLRFEDGTTAEIAASTQLHGGLAGMLPNDAADLVAQSSGVAYRMEGGEVVVAPSTN